MVYIGTAGWNIPRAHRHRFDADGAQLVRYASRLTAAEINTSFYRSHSPETYARWASLVPVRFRFAVKVPKEITHDRALVRVGVRIDQFLDEVAGLGRRLGPLLVQLPPSFAFDSRRVGRFFERLRLRHAGPVVSEPRHATWTTTAADRLLASFRIARVAADPPRSDRLDEPAGWTGIRYFRWHGSPRPYFSPYDAGTLEALADRVRAQPGVETWCIFDNTGSGAAAANALDLSERLTS